MDFSRFLLSSVFISRLLTNSKLQCRPFFWTNIYVPDSLVDNTAEFKASDFSNSWQPDFNIYVPNVVTLQLSHLNYKGVLCRRSLLSRVYCLHACLRDCVGLGNELAMYKMRCLLGKRRSGSRSFETNNHLACKCYFSQEKKVRKNRGKKCLASINSWNNVQDFFLKNYMNRTDCIPSSLIKDVKSSCGRVICSMSNVTNMYGTAVTAGFDTASVQSSTTPTASTAIEKTVMTTVTDQTTKSVTNTITTVEQTTQGFTTQLPLGP